jgi:hypothetical protein
MAVWLLVRPWRRAIYCTIGNLISVCNLQCRMGGKFGLRLRNDAFLRSRSRCGLRAKRLEGLAILSDNRAVALAREGRMLDKQSNGTESAPVWRILRFFGLDNRRDKESPTYTMQRPTEDRFLLARHDLENRIAVLMGGRAAEALIFDGEVSTGASDDLQRATEIASEMVTRYGMVEKLGPRTYARPPQPFLTGTTADRIEASEATEREIDIAVRDIVARAFDRATEVLGARRADLDEGARLLLAQETVTAEQFPAISSARPAVKTAG